MQDTYYPENTSGKFMRESSLGGENYSIIVGSAPNFSKSFLRSTTLNLCAIAVDHWPHQLDQTNQPQENIPAMASTHHFHAHKLFNVEGYVAVITGGGTGIGLMAAQSLAANGAKVYITGRRMEALENAAKTHEPGPEHKGSIIPIGPCDVTKKEDLEKLVQDIEQKEKYIHLLMCNAGVGGPKAEPTAAKATELKKTLWENETVEQWNTTYSTDVTSVYFTTVAFLPLLQAGVEPAGPLPKFAPSVITTSSMSGQMRHAQGHFSYNAAKGATVHLTKMMSAEFQQANIRVNSIAPGYFPSEMTAKSSGSDQKSDLPAEHVQDKGHVPIMRPGKDVEMGMTVLYLTKNEYVNGMVITVDGGVLNVVSGS
nr:rhamnolipids biosynthesis 3-oxoacyl-[acyl-carrier-protein] reductase [Quercus suber]